MEYTNFFQEVKNSAQADILNSEYKEQRWYRGEAGEPPQKQQQQQQQTNKQKHLRSINIPGFHEILANENLFNTWS